MVPVERATAGHGYNKYGHALYDGSTYEFDVCTTMSITLFAMSLIITRWIITIIITRCCTRCYSHWYGWYQYWYRCGLLPF
jgi:hypothetical protein